MPADLVEVSETSALRYAVQRLSRRLRKRAVGEGLTSPLMSALATIERHERLRLGELTTYEQVGKSTMTRLVARLEAEGHLIREVDPDDARGFVVALTEHGYDVLQAANERQDAYLEAQLGALDPADQRAIRAAIPALERLLAIRA